MTPDDETRAWLHNMFSHTAEHTDEPEAPEQPRGNFVPREGHVSPPPADKDRELRQFAAELFNVID